MRRHRSISLLLIGLVLVSVSVVLLAAPVFAQEEEANPLGEPPTFLTGIYDAWVTSPHADFEAEAFIHWNEDGSVPERCATCHSTPGYQDFLGADGSEAGVVNAPAALGTVINCDACHNQVASQLTSVSFPSGVTIENLGDSARCMVCHQGRASGATVVGQITSAELLDQPNTISADLRFVNIHYYAAASTLYGSDVASGYEYDGKAYFPQNQHVPGYDSCYGCHNPHTLELRVEECATCHEGVETREDLVNIRMPGSNVDYDGDGDMEEGIAGEIVTLQEMLYSAIQMYANEVVGTPIVYSSTQYPYFLLDANADGVADEGDTEGYNAFTPALLAATYNYQVTVKDPGDYAHNANYHIQLLFDSIEALNLQLSEAVDLSNANRDSSGHFAFTAEAYRHWDEDGEVSASCSKCHSDVGLPFFLENGVTIATEPAAGMLCSTCHDSVEEFTVYSLAEVTFPSGAIAGFGDGAPSNICLNCHQGRESTTSVNAAIARAGVGGDESSPALRFLNPHYFSAGATLFGTEVKGAYEFDDMAYNGRNEHTRRFNECSDCHEQHELTPRFEECADCHEDIEITGAEDLLLIRYDEEEEDAIDYDGDGDLTEPIRDEIASFEAALYAEIQAYTTEMGAPIIYGAGYPYFFNDTNGNGVEDEGEGVRANAFANWTPNLLRAAYNLQYAGKDPGGFAHNPDYIMQVLYDSIYALGGDEAVASFTRPPVIEPED